MTRARDAADQINRVNSSAANATAITVDASENVLIGTTDDQPPTNSDVSGIALRADGKIAASRASGIAGDFNNNAEGNIVWFRKNGTVVATVSTRTGGGDAPYFGGYTNADTGIAFSSARMYPVDSSGVVANGTRDLGNTDARWGNLWLSGGVYLGGTGSNNKLDDYEEGTWTPTWIVASGSITANSNTSGRYTKIGRVVTVMGYISFASQSGASGAVTVGGLPFTAVTTGFGQSTNQAGGVTSLASGLFNSNCPNVGRIPANTTTILPVFTTANGGTALDFSNLSQQTNHSQFVFQGQYIVNS
tara:strand:- start:344 stop:1255 length:912 start_codon:yes stop_codon:yes gene_type:complete